MFEEKMLFKLQFRYQKSNRIFSLLARRRIYLFLEKNLSVCERTLQLRKKSTKKSKSSIPNHNRAIFHNHWIFFLVLFAARIYRQNFIVETTSHRAVEWERAYAIGQKVINEFSHNFIIFLSRRSLRCALWKCTQPNVFSLSL
jgi:hypothetical protein